MLLAFECGGKLFRVIFAIFINKVHLEYVLLTYTAFRLLRRSYLEVQSTHTKKRGNF